MTTQEKRDTAADYLITRFHDCTHEQPQVFHAVVAMITSLMPDDRITEWLESLPTVPKPWPEGFTGKLPS